jgi:transcriptional regulator GlxA family with amidase domain
LATTREITRNRERRVRRAQEYLLADLDRPFRLPELAKATHSSGRNLQIAFAQAYGVGPMEWFRAIRLQAVHRELREESSSATRIAEVAMRWGFSHLGRFSTEYRKLFGETPSQTLRCALICQTARNEQSHVSRTANPSLVSQEGMCTVPRGPGDLARHR